MAQIDPWLKLLLTTPGGEIRVASNAEPQLVSDGGSRRLYSKPLTSGQIRYLLGEIVSAKQHELLEQQGAAEFAYSGDGLPPVFVTVRAWHTATEARVRAQDEPRPAAAAPSPQHRPAPTASQPEEVKAPPAGRHDAGAGTAVAREVGAWPSKASPSGEPAIHALFRRMVSLKASDLHLCSGERPMVRRHGDMQRLDEFPVTLPANMAALIEPILPERNKRQFAETHDTDFAYEIAGLSRFRCNVFVDRKGTGAVFRTIPTEIVTAEQLGLSQAVKNLCYLSKGLVLVTGPTGSGKSTTLCALVDLINRTRHDHIITIEDPIEFVHPNKNCLVNQREVGEHTSSFKNALRAALREDPDIVLVGELRDLETIAIAVETAETGHLVFGTLHTSTAYSTVDRIIDQFPSDRQAQIRVMLSESLKAVISQTLCKSTTAGRVAAMEVLLVTPAVSNLIREQKTFQIPSSMQTSRKLGMVLLNDALLDLVLAKKVEPKEAYTKAIDKANLANMFKQAGVSIDFLGAQS